MVARNTGPLGWHVPIVDQRGFPTPEFMQKWLAQQRANAVIPSLDTPAEVSAVLDVLGGAEGDLLERGPILWGPLTIPSGRIPIRSSPGWSSIASPGNAAQFLAGSSPPAFADVHDADLSLSDILTNNVSTTKHGFAPKLPNDVKKFLNGTGTYTAPLAADILPTQTGHTGEYLQTDGAGVLSWAAAAGGGDAHYAAVPARWNNFDTGAIASLCNMIVTTKTIKVTQLHITINNATIGNVYSGFIATGSVGGNIVATVGTPSARFTTTATGYQTFTLNFATPITLTAGTRYIFGVVITSGTGTTACRAVTAGDVVTSYADLPLDAGAIMVLTVGSANFRCWFTQNSDAPGATVAAGTSTTGNYNIAFSWTF